jgi:polyferredoxin
MKRLLPLIIGILIAAALYKTVGWWGFLILFPWIGLALTAALFLAAALPPGRQGIARRLALLIILPALLLFVPVANNENFQLEGVVLLILAGYFSKGVIHYAVAKVFGPLVWGRGFCGWACWTAAVLEWLPVHKGAPIPAKYKNFRYLSLALSVLLPLALVFALAYDVRGDYLNRQELLWMLAGNLVYYLAAIPLAFLFRDRRAFCKVACPVALVMKVPASFSLIRRRPTGNACLRCGRCTAACPMDVDVMAFISQGRAVNDTECILCRECAAACPAGAIK